MRISLSTFVYLRYSLIEAIQRIAVLGYDAVELWGGRPHAYAVDMDSSHLHEIKAALQDNNLAISNFIPAQFRYPVNIAIADEKIRRGSLDYLKQSIDTAMELGSPFVSFCPGFSIFPQSQAQAWDTLLKSLSELIHYATGMPLTLLLEPAHRMESDLVVSIDDGLRVVKALESGLGLLPDTGHLFVSHESLTDAVKKTACIPCHWHIDDNFGISDEHLLPGDGNIDFFLFLKSLVKSGYTGNLTVELGYSYITDPDAAACKSFKNLRQFIEEASA